jgi:hypothetical protein
VENQNGDGHIKSLSSNRFWDQSGLDQQTDSGWIISGNPPASDASIACSQAINSEAGRPLSRTMG